MNDIAKINTVQAEAQQDTCGLETGLITVDQAFELIIEHTRSLGDERLALDDALNHYLAEDVYSDIDLPILSQSAVDGYAIATDQDIIAGQRFKLVGEMRAGQEPLQTPLQHGQAIRIFTGAAVPENTFTVARQEIVQLEGNEIVITKNLNAHADIRDRGEEIQQGQCIASCGQQLTVGAIAALSMAGVQNVQVHKYPKIAVVITGDEVASSIEDYQQGMIFDANAPLISAWFQSEQPQHHVDIIHVADHEDEVQQLFDRLKDCYDLVISTGGISVGDYDFIRPVCLNLGFQQIFWKVKQKPGKPLFFAQFQKIDSIAQSNVHSNTQSNVQSNIQKLDLSSESKSALNSNSVLHSDQSKVTQSETAQSTTNHTCYLLALPGNPAAVYMSMQLYVRQILQCFQGVTVSLPWMSAIITHDLKADRRERFLRMQLGVNAGQMSITSLAKQQSHMLSNLMQAQCIVRVPADQHIQVGDVLDMRLI